VSIVARGLLLSICDIVDKRAAALKLGGFSDLQAAIVGKQHRFIPQSTQCFECLFAKLT
jgi:hypothetical protein